jgi:allantoinase
VLTEGRKRGLSLERAAELLATNPAKIAGLWPRKGELRVGSDADLILVNLEHDWTLEPEMLYSRHQHSPYAGLEFSVRIEQVLVRGQTVVQDGLISGSPIGRWQRKLEAIVQDSAHFIKH